MPPPRDGLGLERWTLLVRAELGRLLGGRLTVARDGVDAGRLTTLLVRDGLTRGWLTLALLVLDRGTDLVSVGPPRERLTALVAAVELGGRWTTVVLAGVVRVPLIESTLFVLGRVRVTVPARLLGACVTVRVRALGARVTVLVWVLVGRVTVPVRVLVARVTVPVRVLVARDTVWVRVGIVRARLTEPGDLTIPRLERTAGCLARTVVGR